MKQWEIKITGRVQGVGFRWFAQKKAEETNIKGWVKNTSDGGVQVMALGEEIDLKTFMDHLRFGPSAARVINLTKTEMPSLEEFSDFRVRY
jgi:acylphosphatase